MDNWQGRQVLVIGAARQGLALARYLSGQGAEVILNDRRPVAELQAEQAALAGLPAGAVPVRWACGGHPLSLLDGTGLVCPSGGVPLTLPLIVEARNRGIPLSNDSQIFLEAAPCPVAGITGSAGKTTTTTLVGLIAQAAAHQQTGAEQEVKFHPSSFRDVPIADVPIADVPIADVPIADVPIADVPIADVPIAVHPSRVWVGGNIGSPLVSNLDDMGPSDLAIMELSSFQLELMTRAPQIAAVLNVTPNHLDRHGTMESYTAAKARILEFQEPSGAAVLGRDDPGAWSLAGKVRGRLLSFGLSELPAGQEGTFLAGDAIYVRQGQSETRLLERSSIRLRGEHNLLNVLAACAIAAAAGLPFGAFAAAIEEFRGVPHRLEFVRTWGGAAWYNDSIATAPERAMAAVRSFDEPLVLLAGGRDKDLPWEDFAALVSRRVTHLVLFGEAVEKIARAFGPIPATQGNGTGQGLKSILRCAGLRDAVRAAAQFVEPGQVVLLSPGGTSYDEFKDFEERGKCFAQWVKELP